MQYETTQAYIDAVEGSVIQKSNVSLPMAYPKQFCPEISELFGYIVSVGSLAEATHEINFADCAKFTEMPQRITTIYNTLWGNRPIRLNSSGFPRICGRKYVAFVKIVLGGKTLFEPGQERIPNFVLRSGNLDVKKGFLKAVIGTCPKKLVKDAWVFGFRNNFFKIEIAKLLLELKLPFNSKLLFLTLNENNLNLVKQTLELTTDSWWTE
jgi:hypothetical protein